MKPNKLVVQNFGPFAQRTEIDFDRMGNSLYLITGNTGSGKTTIFDAIVYALYGTASGDGRSGISTEAFHSDFAKHDNGLNEDMSVELTFSNAGHEYIVWRKLKWGKSGTAKTVNRESALTEDGHLTYHGKGVESKDDVTKRITELLGLDADQFKRIIMLSQGEFRKFLEAKSSERGEILGKLYKNKRHEDFQARLKAAYTMAEEKKKDLKKEAGFHRESLRLAEDLPEETMQKLALDHPEFLPTLKSIIEEMKAALQGMSAEVETLRKEQIELTSQKDLAKHRNEQLDALEVSRRSLQSLEEEKGRIDSLRDTVKLVLRAQKIVAFEAARDSAVSQLAMLEKSIVNLEADSKRLEESMQGLKAAAEEAKAKCEPAIEELTEKVSKLTSVLHFYDELIASMRVNTENTTAWNNSVDAYENAMQGLQQKKDLRERLNATLDSLASAGEAAVANAKLGLEALDGRRKSLAGLQKELNGLYIAMSEQQKLETGLAKATQAVLLALENYSSVNAAFIKGQSGLLAKNMREKLQTEPAVICPVCGTTHTKDTMEHFAAAEGEQIPDQKEVTAALEEWNRAKNAEQKANAAVESKVTEVKEKKTALMAKAEELLGITEWEQFSSEGTLDNAMQECEKQMKAATAVYDKAVADMQAKEKAQKDRAAVDMQIEAGEKYLAELTSKREQLKSAIDSSATSVRNWEKQLEGYPATKMDAMGEIDRMQKEIAAFRDKIEKTQAAAANCEKELTAKTGQLTQARADKANREEAVKEAEAAYTSALDRGNFADTEAYHQALSPQGTLLTGAALEEWLERKQKVLGIYDEQVTKVKAVIEEQEETTKNITRVDLTELEKAIADMGAAIRAKAEQEKAIGRDVEINSKAYAALQGLQVSIVQYGKVIDKIKPLSDAANGGYSFSRYVLADFFKSIVDKAKDHFEEMTDGKLTLASCGEGDRRGSIGLDLRIINTLRNSERFTASLSGGQSFEASLALALGLSDVVQMETDSPIQIDSMFIDEGFGSLDGERLEKAINLLKELSAGNRQIGIISHVERLDDELHNKICVFEGDNGSYVTFETE